MGWIETYVDPQNSRGYWEGWVAIVDKEQSKLYAKLVEISESVIQKLPWPKEMEKDSFLSPDYTVLNMITYASYKRFVGINIPNYDDIRETIGFKNVSLANTSAPMSSFASPYFSQQDIDQY
jgi:dipeptidyl-peptidase-3